MILNISTTKIAIRTRAVFVNGISINKNADIVLGVDNKQITKIDDLINYIDITKSVGDTVLLKVLRNSVTNNINIELTERPST
jgi:S1-C subfamily serine protease